MEFISIKLILTRKNGEIMYTHFACSTDEYWMRVACTAFKYDEIVYFPVDETIAYWISNARDNGNRVIDFSWYGRQVEQTIIQAPTSCWNSEYVLLNCANMLLKWKFTTVHLYHDFCCIFRARLNSCTQMQPINLFMLELYGSMYL